MVHVHDRCRLAVKSRGRVLGASHLIESQPGLGVIVAIDPLVLVTRGTDEMAGAGDRFASAAVQKRPPTGEEAAGRKVTIAEAHHQQFYIVAVVAEHRRQGLKEGLLTTPADIIGEYKTSAGFACPLPRLRMVP